MSLPFEVKMFGSTVNGFGSDKSDLDLCLVLPSTHPRAADFDAAAVVVEAGALLEAAGMAEVCARVCVR